MPKVKKLSEVEEKEPKKKKTKHLGRKVIGSISVIVLLTFLLSVMKGTTDMNLGYQYLFWFFWIDWPKFWQTLLELLIYFAISMIAMYLGITLYKAKIQVG